MPRPIPSIRRGIAPRRRFARAIHVLHNIHAFAEYQRQFAELGQQTGRVGTTGRRSGETAENRNAWGGGPMRSRGIGRARFIAVA